MTWFKVDDGLPRSRKVLSLPRSVRLQAIGLWTLAGAWSASEELDGHVPDYVVTELGGTPRIVAALVKSGLWEEAEEGAQFHKWPEYQPTRADLEAARKKETERKRKWRERNSPDGVPPGQDAGREPESGHPDPTRPDPTRPVPKGTNEERAPLPPEPPDDEYVPTEIGTGARPPKPARASPAEITFVRTHVGQRMPRDIETQLANISRRLIRDHSTPIVEAALREWGNRPKASPGLLTNLVADALRTGRTTPRPSTTDQRVAQAQALKRPEWDTPTHHPLDNIRPIRELE